MKDRCANYWDGIVNLAEGKVNESAQRHVETCAECSTKLEQLKTMMSVGDLRYYDAPPGLITRVKDMLPAPARRSANLLRSSIAWSGARAVAEDFQVVVGEGSTQIRMMYSRSGEGWEVMGRAPASYWSVRVNETDLPIEEDGRFSFHAAKLSETGLTLAGPEGELFIPSAEELLSSGPHDGN